MSERLYFRQDGQGTALTLLHGGWLDSRAWRKHLPKLGESYLTLVPDLRGYGRSTHPDEPWSLAAWGGDVVGMWDEVGVERSHLVGVSVGGLVALELATAHPDRVADLVLVSTTSRFDDDARAAFLSAAENFDADEYEAALAQHLRSAFTETFRKDHPDEVKAYQAMARETPQISARNTMLTLVTADFRSALPGIVAPTLVITGDHDAVTGGHHPEDLLAGIPGSASSVFAGAGHSLHLERPTDLVDCLCRFLGPGALPGREGYGSRTS
jgi:pimeloyl-ACP methyl ester carboxylesterase